MKEETKALERLADLFKEEGLIPTGDSTRPVVKVEDLRGAGTIRTKEPLDISPEELAAVEARVRYLQFN